MKEKTNEKGFRVGDRVRTTIEYQQTLTSLVPFCGRVAEIHNDDIVIVYTDAGRRRGAHERWLCRDDMAFRIGDTVHTTKEYSEHFERCSFSGIVRRIRVDKIIEVEDCETGKRHFLHQDWLCECLESFQVGDLIRTRDDYAETFGHGRGFQGLVEKISRGGHDGSKILTVRKTFGYQVGDLTEVNEVWVIKCEMQPSKECEKKDVIKEITSMVGKDHITLITGVAGLEKIAIIRIPIPKKEDIDFEKDFRTLRDFIFHHLPFGTKDRLYKRISEEEYSGMGEKVVKFNKIRDIVEGR